MKLFDLTGDVAVVIGATGVLGGALAEGLAQAGATVAVLGRNAERGAMRIKKIKGDGGMAAFFSADAQNRESLHRAHEAIEKALGVPAILVNAAGVFGPIQLVAESEPARWIETLLVNTVGPYLTCRAFVPP